MNPRKRRKTPPKLKAATKTAKKKTEDSAKSRSFTRLGLYAFLFVAVALLILLFRYAGYREATVSRPSSAAIAPAALSRPAPTQMVPIPAPADASPALETAPPMREFWSWHYEEGVTGLSRSGLDSVQQIASVLKDHPHLLARVQVGSASSTSQAGAMAAERASFIAHALQEQGILPSQVVIDTDAGLPKQGSVVLESR